MNAERNSTASRCRQMIGTYLRDWKADTSNDVALNGIILADILRMLHFARRIHAIDDTMDGALYRHAHFIISLKTQSIRKLDPA
jgi:hypothetical protein